MKKWQKRLELVSNGMGDFKTKHKVFTRYVRQRDGYKCVICKAPSDTVHHILYRHSYPLLMFNVNNGIVLCEYHENECHSRV